MIPILYDKTETSFQTQGLGRLTDAISCTVQEQKNGSYELTMEYPVGGLHYSDITLQRIILAKTNMTDQHQPFRIYKVTKPMFGAVTVYAQHVCYDLSGYPVAPYSAVTVAGAISGMVSNCPISIPFTINTNKADIGDMVIDKPTTVRSVMESILGVYGGTWKYNRWTCSLLATRGQNRGSSVRYGKNLTDLNQDEMCENLYSGVYGYYQSGETRINTSPAVISTGANVLTRVLVLDLSSEFSATPDGSTLLVAVNKYIQQNNMSTPEISMSVSFDTLGYDVFDLCDSILITLPKLGVSVTAECVSLTYDTLHERITYVEIGTPKRTIADTIAGKASTSDLLKASTITQTGDEFTVNVTTGDWSGGQAVKAVAGLLANASHIVFSNGLGYLPITTDGTITFTSTTTPSSAITVKIMQYR